MRDALGQRCTKKTGQDEDLQQRYTAAHGRSGKAKVRADWGTEVFGQYQKGREHTKTSSTNNSHKFKRFIFGAPAIKKDTIVYKTF